MSEQGEHLKQIDDIEKAHCVANGMNFLMPTAIELQQYIRSIASEPDETCHYIRLKPDAEIPREGRFYMQIQFFELDQYGVKVVSPLEDLIDRVDTQARNFDGSGISARYSLGKYLEDYLDETHNRSYRKLGGYKGIPIPNEVIVNWGAEKVEELVTKANNYGNKLGEEYSEREALEKQRQEREEKEAKQAQEEYEQVCELEKELAIWLPFSIGEMGLEKGSAKLCDYKEDLFAEKHHLEVLTEILGIFGLEGTLAEVSDKQRTETMRKLNSIYASGYERAKGIFDDPLKRKNKYTWVFDS